MDSSRHGNISSGLALDMASDMLAKIDQSLTGSTIPRNPRARGVGGGGGGNTSTTQQQPPGSRRNILNPVSGPQATPRSLKFDHLGGGRGGGGGGQDGPGTPGSSLKRALDGLNLGGARGRGHGSSSSSASSKQPSETDLKNPVLITFGTQVVLRSAQIGKCLSLDPASSSPTADPYAPATVDVDGSGVGADDEVFTIVNVHFRNDKGPVRFGDTVALRSEAPATYGKFLAVAADPQTAAGGSTRGPANLQLNRTTFGAAEKWTLLNAGVSRSGGVNGATQSRPVQESKSLANVVHSCDRVAFRTMQNNYMQVVLTPIPNTGPQAKAGSQTVVASVTAASQDVAGGKQRGGLGGVWNIIRAGTPFLADWTRNRPFLTGDFLFETKQGEAGGGSAATKAAQTAAAQLASFPVPIQESLVVDDVLSAMLGVEGQYIAVNDQMFSFNLREGHGLDESLSYLVERILPLCVSLIRVQRYVETHSRYEFGLTAHAFCAGLRELVKEYTVLVAQLENLHRKGQLNLQKLFFYVQPSLKVMVVLEYLCSQAENCCGGDLLNTIHHVATTRGNQVSAPLFDFLLQKASFPYFAMLERWIYHGSVEDQYKEFMIRERKDLSRDELRQDYNANYWDKRYTIRGVMVPWFLKPCADQILTTGKYLNVIRGSDQAIRCPFAAPVRWSTIDRTYVVIVERAYNFASKALLDLLVTGNKLFEKLKSIKNYFFMSTGDMFVHFLDTAMDELNRYIGEIDVRKLDSLLKMAIHISTAQADPHKDNLYCVMESYNLSQHLEAIHSTSQGMDGPIGLAADSNKLHALAAPDLETSTLRGIEGFSLGYQVDWPLSLIISRQALIKYQILFRHLFFCKHVEKLLCSTWQEQQVTKELDLGRAMGRSYALRQRMLHFVQNLIYYITVEVLEPRWHSLIVDVKKAATVDDVIQFHQTFLDSCLKECLLTNPDLLKILTKLMMNCVLFANQIKRFMESVALENKGAGEDSWDTTYFGGRFDAVPGDGRRQEKAMDLARKTRIRVQSQHIRKIVLQRAYIGMLDNFHDSFNHLVADFMASLKDETHAEYHMHLANLCTRLDFNEFYDAGP